MTREERIKELFLRAREAGTPTGREAVLREACQGDPELRQQVESLLHAHEEARTFLAKTVQIPDSDTQTETQ